MPRVGAKAHSGWTRYKQRPFLDGRSGWFRSISRVRTSSGRNGIDTLLTPIDRTDHSISENLRAIVGKENIIFHCIGFGAGHDVRVLNLLARGGSSPGTFQYAESSNHIDDCVNKLVEALAGRVFSCTVLSHGTGKAGTRVSFDTEGFARILLTAEDISKGTISANIKKNTVSFSLVPAEEGTKTALDLSIWDAQERLERVADKVFLPSPTKKVLDECLESIVVMQENIQLLVKKAYRVEKSERSSLVARCMELTALVDALRARVALAIAGSLKGTQIAEWRDLASRPRLANRRANKELDKRAINNAAILDEALNSIKETVATMNFATAVVPADVAENCVCLYTLNKPMDALRDGDCMALTLQVRRSEATIFDPNQLIIDAIGTSFMTCDTFFETSAIAKRYADSDTVEVPLKSIENVAVKSQSSFSGGFDKNVAGSLIKGTGAENINAILPLFLFNEHWQIAKIKAKPVLGYVCTLDVTGYTGSQMTTVPFLVLHRALQDLIAKDDTWTRFVLRLVLETCTAIYRPRIEFREDLLKRYNGYLEGPAGRVSDVVPSTRTFIMHLYTALLSGDLRMEEFQEHAKALCNAIIEETVRRTLRNVESLPEPVSFYGIDRQQDITKAVDEYQATLDKTGGGLSDAGLTFRMLALGIREADQGSTAASEAKKTSVAPSTASGKAGGEVSGDITLQMAAPGYKAQYSPAASRFVADIERSVINELRPTFDALRFIADLNNDIDAEKILRNLSEFARLAMVVQAWEQRKQQDRLAAVEKGTYVNFFGPASDEEAKRFIKDRANTIIRGERQAVVNKILSIRNSSAANQAAFAFTSVTDLDEAAGIVMQNCAYIGRKSFGAFLSEFQTTNDTKPLMGKHGNELAVEKLQMFILGEYRGVSLRVDRQHKRADPRWKPSKKNMHRVWLTYRNVLSRGKFARIFPENMGQIDRWVEVEKEGKRMFPAGLE